MQRFSPGILDGFPALGAMFRDSFERYADRVACIDMDGDLQKGSWTYREIGASARRFATLLRDEGWQPGDRLSIALKNQSTYLVAAAGGIFCGAVICPLDYDLPVDVQLGELHAVEAKGLVIAWDLWQLLTAEGKSGLAGTTVIVTDAPEGADLAGARRWQLPSAPATFAIVERAREDLANIVFTSGTGGVRKGCLLSHDNYLQELKAIFLAHAFPSDGRLFSLLPVKHGGEFVSGILAPFACGATIVHQYQFDEQHIASTMRNQRPTNIVLFPPIIEGLKAEIEKQIRALPNWKRGVFAILVWLNVLLTKRRPSHAISRFLLGSVHREFGGRLREIFCGGLSIHPKTVAFFYRLGIPVVVGYGLTETCMAVTANTLKPSKGDNVGIPYPGLSLQIRNPTPDGVGQVWVKGRTVALGYLANDALTRQAFVDGWFQTGDLGRLDTDGALQLFGREGDAVTIEAGSIRAYPDYWEAVLGDLPAQLELAIFSTGQILQGQSAVDQLLLVANLGGKPSEGFVSELRRRLATMAGPGRISHYAITRNEFPRTTSAKIKRRALAELLREEPGQFALSVL